MSIQTDEVRYNNQGMKKRRIITHWIPNLIYFFMLHYIYKRKSKYNGQNRHNRQSRHNGQSRHNRVGAIGRVGIVGRVGAIRQSRYSRLLPVGCL